MGSPNSDIAGLVLFHGAGGNKEHPTLIALEDGLDVAVSRHNFPYRDKKPVGPAGPNSMKVLVETVDTAVGQAAERLGVSTTQIVAGGRSLGGRAASVAAAQGLELGGLLLLSYPLHPPGKPEKLRTEHFGEIDCPALVVQGESDPFGRPAEIEEHFRKYAGKASFSWVKGNHGPKNVDDIIVSAVEAWLVRLND